MRSMSADNWEVCPRCLRRAQVEMNVERVRVQSLYGTVSRDEYEQAAAALPADSTPNEEKFRTFREDYAFYGANTGEIIAEYSGHCTVCDLSVELKAERKFWS